MHRKPTLNILLSFTREEAEWFYPALLILLQQYLQGMCTMLSGDA
jgi:hypothetical protein